jgi:hypothetical protein
VIGAQVISSGPDAMAEEDLCLAIGEDLAKHYPGYPWMVGVDHGSVCIDLGVEKPIDMQRYGYRLNVATVIGPGGQKRVMEAGGELLERFGLRRGRAPDDAADLARENGLDVSGARNKSRDEKWW